MKKIFLLSILTIAFSLQSYSQSAQEIIDNYIETIGGMDNLNLIKSTEFVFTVKNFGMEFKGSQTKQRDGKQLTKITFQGKEMIQPAYDGETLWSTNFMTMKNEKAESEASDNFATNEAKEFFDALIQSKELGYKVDKLEDEDVEGVKCFKLKVTKSPIKVKGEPKESIEYYYIDQDNNILVQVESEILEGNNAGKKIQTVFSEYQEVGGVYFPHIISSKFEGKEQSTIEVEKITINPTIDQNIFKFRAD